jgi:tetratricopeptide (TPR) repeat protein
MGIFQPRIRIAATVAVVLAVMLTGCGRKAIHYEGTREQILAQATEFIDNWRGNGADLKEALKRLNQLVAEDPNDAPALVQMARVSYKTGFRSGDDYNPAGLQLAEQFLDRAEALDPNLYELYVVRGYVKCFEKAYTDADRMTAKAEQLRPEDTRTPLLRAYVLKRQGRFEEALPPAKRSLVLAKTANEKARALESVAELSEKLGHPDEVRQAYEEQIKEEPGSAWAKGNYAQFLIRQKDYDKAISYAEQALQQMDYGVGHRTLGQAYYRKAEGLWEKKDYAGAGPLLEKSVQADPDDADAWYLLGWYYRETARQQRSTELLDKSGDAFEKALDVDPNHPGAKKELAEHRKYRSRFN